MNGGVAVDTEIALPELPHYDYMQYQSNLESMDLTSVIEAKVEIAASNLNERVGCTNSFLIDRQVKVIEITTIYG